MKKAIDSYLPIFKNKDKWEEIYELEYYKWIAIETFQSNYQRIFDKNEDIYLALTDALKDTKNLKYFAPINSLTTNAKYAADGIREALSILYNEDLNLEDRVKKYRDRFRDITIQNDKAGKFQGKSKTYRQDDRTISLLLSLRYPSKYYLYISSIFDKASVLLGSDYNYRCIKTGEITNLKNYTMFCDEVKSIISQDTDLKKWQDEFLKNKKIDDYSNGNLLTQTFIYSICKHIEAESKFIDVKVLDKENLKLIAPRHFKFKPFKNSTDYINEASNQRALGKWGEFYVVDYENKRLNALGKKCVHRSIEKGGDGYGYDILSYNDDGSERYIEVKTTKQDFSTPFYITARELEFSNLHEDNYYLYRVYDYDNKNKSGRIAIIKGSLKDYVGYPTQYQIALKE